MLRVRYNMCGGLKVVGCGGQKVRGELAERGPCGCAVGMGFEGL